MNIWKNGLLQWQDRVGAKYFEKDLSKFQVQSQCTCT